MKNHEFENFTAIMYGLADNFSADITAKGLDFRFECLKKYSLEQINSAAMTLVRTRKFTKMPTIAELIEAIEGTPEDKGEEQAMAVIAAISQCGRYGHPRFEDPKTAAIVSRIGWNNLCDMHTDKQKFFVKDFIESYKGETRRTETAQIADVQQDINKLIAGIAKEVA